MYRHDDLVPPEDTFTDLMGRELSLQVVKEKIALCHSYGMKAMAYGAIYAASKDFTGSIRIGRCITGTEKSSISSIFYDYEHQRGVALALPHH